MSTVATTSGSAIHQLFATRQHQGLLLWHVITAANSIWTEMFPARAGVPKAMHTTSPLPAGWIMQFVCVHFKTQWLTYQSHSWQVQININRYLLWWTQIYFGTQDAIYYHLVLLMECSSLTAANQL